MLYLILFWLGLLVVIVVAYVGSLLWPWVVAIHKEAEEEYKKHLDSMGRPPDEDKD